MLKSYGFRVLLPLVKAFLFVIVNIVFFKSLIKM